MELDRFLLQVKSGYYQSMVEQIRHLIEIGEVEQAQKLKKKLPAVTVSATYRGGRKDEFLTAYIPKVIVDLDGISAPELVRVRQLVEKDVHTYACFVSPSGKGLKIIVTVNSLTGELPKEIAEINKFHKVAYQIVADYFAKLLDVKVDTSGRDKGRLCYVSYDPALFLNTNAEAFIWHEAEKKKPVSASKSKRIFQDSFNIVSKVEEYVEGNRNNFIFYVNNLLNRQGVPLEEARKLSVMRFTDVDTQEIEAAVQSAYSHVDEHGVMGTVKKSSVVEAAQEFLTKNYLTRYNVVSTQVEVCDLKKTKREFLSLTDRIKASIWLAMVNAGIDIHQTDLRSLLLSDHSSDFDPFQEYFNNLPAWDGTDYIAQLADTVQVDDDQDYWTFCLRKWLVAMVASLIQKSTVNHLMLVLNSQQGFGKSHWTELLLPPELRRYYANASVNDKDKDFMLKLCYRALVSIEEFDVLSQQETARLKKIITQSGVEERKAYGENEENYVRHASLIASTNNHKMLVDPTGSRRFVPFTILKMDYEFTIDYTQLYAQVMHLLNEGYRFWLNLDEIDQLSLHNERYQAVSPEEEFLFTYFTREPIHNQPEYLTASEILKRISHRTGMQINKNALIMLGKILHRYNFESKTTKKGNIYKIYEIGPDEVERRFKLANPDSETQQQSDNESKEVQNELPF